HGRGRQRPGLARRSGAGLGPPACRQRDARTGRRRRLHLLSGPRLVRQGPVDGVRRCDGGPYAMSGHALQAAYEVNERQVDSNLSYEVACDPRRSVVVEACAGAGKTWMLVSRILRALLDGVQPNHILAITFTKKAAGEMRERLHGWLRQFAQASEEARRLELRIRGVPESALDEMSPRLQALYGQWLEDGRGVDIHTMHGWFSRLVKAAPLDMLNELQLPPELQLIEDTSEHWPELWGRFLRRVDMDAPSASKQAEEPGSHLLYAAFREMVREVGRFNVEAWLKEALENRLELTLADQAGRLEAGVESAGDWSPQWAGLAHPAEALLRASVREHF